MTYPTDISQLSPIVANEWLTLAIDNILMEYPHLEPVYAQSDADYVPHRRLHPTFFGSLDWHSCVEMYWVAARIMRLIPGLPGEARAIAVIDELLTPEHIARETAYCAERTSFERPYGWGWVHKLQNELERGTTESAAGWAAALRPLSDQFAEQYRAWLPKLTYPQRIGMHTNTAFALTLSWPEMERSYPDLIALARARALDWFRADKSYPFAYEPSGADFLSAGLCEAVLMQHVLDADTFRTWIGVFLPEAGSNWLAPAVVSDASDGQLAHLHGLNLSRAWALGELAAVLPDRREELAQLREAHIAASISEVSGSHYMVEHWLAAYALLLLTEPS
ncbi:MAG: DUF2891 domain-containing protein [Thermomicrobiales bacterium]|nr:DUF2891 domain-containing protein [Thermomicrobiales bacterium]